MTEGMIVLLVIAGIVVLVMAYGFYKVHLGYKQQDAQKLQDTKNWERSTKICADALSKQSICVIIRTKDGKKIETESEMIDVLTELGVVVKYISDENAKRAWSCASDVGINTDYLLIGTTWTSKDTAAIPYENLDFRLLTGNGTRILGCKYTEAADIPLLARNATVLLAEILSRKVA